MYTPPFPKLPPIPDFIAAYCCKPLPILLIGIFFRQYAIVRHSSPILPIIPGHALAHASYCDIFVLVKVLQLANAGPFSGWTVNRSRFDSSDIHCIFYVQGIHLSLIHI